MIFRIFVIFFTFCTIQALQTNINSKKMLDLEYTIHQQQKLIEKYKEGTGNLINSLALQEKIIDNQNKIIKKYQGYRYYEYLAEFKNE
tara:strand:+ start:518 stop:781 length:264 start_codon:yes stop_codon:yes gene_type:complete